MPVGAICLTPLIVPSLVLGPGCGTSIQRLAVVISFVIAASFGTWQKTMFAWSDQESEPYRVGDQPFGTHSMTETLAYEDAGEMLDADHKAVKNLFVDFNALCDDNAPAYQKQLSVQRICQELTVHAQIEEELFYPKVRKAIGHGSWRRWLRLLSRLIEKDNLFHQPERARSATT